MIKNDDSSILLDFAEKIGQLTEGQANLDKNLENHLKEHLTDRIMQWCILGLQTIVILFLGYLKLTGKI